MRNIIHRILGTKDGASAGTALGSLVLSAAAFAVIFGVSGVAWGQTTFNTRNYATEAAMGSNVLVGTTYINHGEGGVLVIQSLTGNTLTVDSDIVTNTSDFPRILSVVAGGSTSSGVTISGNTLNIGAGANAGVIGSGGVGEAYGGLIGVGTVEGNTVNLNLGSVAFDIFGGAVGTGDATGNKAYIYGTSANSAGHGVYGGAVSLSGNVRQNEVFIYGGTIAQRAVGGLTTSGNATENKVTVDGGVFNGVANSDILGARIDTAASGTYSVTDNKVNLISSTLNGAGDIAGAMIHANYNNFTVQDNAVTIGTTLGSGTYNVYGAIVYRSAANGTVTANLVTINGGTISGEIAGAKLDSGRGSASKNIVTIAGTAALGGDVMGAYVYDPNTSGNVRENEVRFQNHTGTVAGEVFGGRTDGGNAEENKVVVTSPSTVFSDKVYGGATAAGNATENTVSITGAASVNGDVYGGSTSAGNATKNIVSITGAASVNGNVYGGNSDTVAGNASENDVTLDGANLASAKIVYGGYSALGSANQNKVRITSSATAVGTVYGGQAAGSSGNAEQNEVYLTGLTAGVGEIFGGSSDGGRAINNKVEINGASLSGNVTVGLVSTGTGDATGNSLKLSGDIGVSTATVSLRGGYSTGSGDYFTNNVLKLERATITGNEFQNIQGFQYYEFLLDATQFGTGYAALKTQNLIYNRGTEDAHVRRVDMMGGSILNVGDEITLIAASSFTANSSNPTDTLAGAHGVLNIYDFEVSKDGTNLVAKVTNVRSNPQSKALTEVPLANLAFLLTAGDFVADKAVAAATQSVYGAQGFTAYGMVGYGKTKYETGSHVDVTGISGQIGVSVGNLAQIGAIAAALFVEFGTGEYESFNEFVGIGSVKGDGDVSYFGAGLLARADLGNPDGSRPYIEASVRFGKSSSDFQTSDFLVTGGRQGKFDLNTNYYGIHAGIGYILDINQAGTTLDASVKYLFAEREGADVNILGDNVRFGDIQSQRIRAGARLNVGYSEMIRPFVGGYFEHEFDGDSEVVVRGTRIPTATISGNTGIGELGLNLISPSMPLEMEVGVQGSGGKREGFAGSVKLNYAF
ncbi:MAG: hypothetical protein LBO66_14700 [Deltaproteobacteria bacterium]|nr:hypothetical protein [Deltaproteobacteria bacterium]